MIAEQQPALVCFGHLHRNMELSEGATRVFCTASASSAKKASFRIFDIEQTGHGRGPAWTVRMRLKSIAADQTRFTLADEKRWTFTL